MARTTVGCAWGYRSQQTAQVAWAELGCQKGETNLGLPDSQGGRGDDGKQVASSGDLQGDNWLTGRDYGGIGYTKVIYPGFCTPKLGGVVLNGPNVRGGRGERNSI